MIVHINYTLVMSELNKVLLVSIGQRVELCHQFSQTMSKNSLESMLFSGRVCHKENRFYKNHQIQNFHGALKFLYIKLYMKTIYHLVQFHKHFLKYKENLKLNYLFENNQNHKNI